MKVSIITVCYNAEKYIKDTIESVLEQDYPNIEYIIIDGASTDQTLKIIQNYNDSIDCLISEKDRGIYDAMNKGIAKATGDVVGILNADDVYENQHIISLIMQNFADDISIVYGDIKYVKQDDLSKVVRKWRAGKYILGKFKWGWMPPHPGFFIKKLSYKEYGVYFLHLATSADYELMLRMLEVHQLSNKYLPKTITRMRIGGASNVTLSNRWKANRNDKKAWSEHRIKPYWFTFILKPLRKLPQLLKI